MDSKLITRCKSYPQGAQNLSNVSATYASDGNRGISVVNSGYNEKTGEWKEIEGRARFIEDETVGSLKVRFSARFMAATTFSNLIK